MRLEAGRDLPSGLGLEQSLRIARRRAAERDAVIATSGNSKRDEHGQRDQLHRK